MRGRAWLLLLLVPPLGSACSRRIDPTRVDAKDAAARAMSQYDTNRDGFLDAHELRRCPGLWRALERFDRNKDARFSQAEVEEYLAGYRTSQIGLQEVVLKVTLDGRPLSGAKVDFEPEAFLGSAVQPARGVTDERGRARMHVEGAAKPGCQLGVYRVRISKLDARGRETVPARYNTHTELGTEVAPAMRGLHGFHLRSR